MLPWNLLIYPSRSMRKAIQLTMTYMKSYTRNTIVYSGMMRQKFVISLEIANEVFFCDVIEPALINTHQRVRQELPQQDPSNA